MTVFEKLAIKIKADLGFSVENFERTYAGIHERSRGAFVWTCKRKVSGVIIGSTSTATELLKKDKLVYIGGSTVQIEIS
jgi:hypothetical protein